MGRDVTLSVKPYDDIWQNIANILRFAKKSGFLAPKREHIGRSIRLCINFCCLRYEIEIPEIF